MCPCKTSTLDLSFVRGQRKMAHINIAWLYCCFYAVTILIPTTLSLPSSQVDIDNIANDLVLEVFVETNHLSTGTYNITYKLTNAGTVQILQTDDWEIIYSMHNRDILTKRQFIANGLVVKPYKETLYKITPQAKRWPGLASGETSYITITAKGLSVFRQDTHPRFIVSSQSTMPKTIQSTDDITLGFVKLDPNSNNDYSKMSGIQRTMMIPDVMDMDRVPATIVCPPPLNITIAPEVPLLELGTVTKFHVWADSSVSDAFKKYFEAVFRTIPTTTVLEFVNSEPPANVDKIYIQQTGPDSMKSEDYYELAVRPKTGGRNFNLIHMSATSEAGLHNAVESLMSATGLYDILPDMTIVDDARFGHRALSLDLTKNFFSYEVIERVLKLMSTYKLNKLEMNLGSDYAWRLEVKDIPELTNYASKRCLTNDANDCLPPYSGAGAQAAPTASGFYTVEEFARILRYAYSLHIDVIPRFNFLGGLLSAKRATKLRFDNLERTDRRSANKVNLVSILPKAAKRNQPEDEMTIDGLLDPCRTQTFTFINTVISQVNRIYSMASVPFKSFHAGGDELTQFLGEFPSCKKAKVKSTAEALSTMIGAMQTTLSSVNAVLHVNEEAITDPSTGDCLNIPPTSKMSQSNLVAHFYKTFPGSPEEWDLSTTQLAYMDGAVAPPPSPANPNGTYDALLPYNGPQKGLASWILPYRCANRGYKIVLKPENFFSLDQAYELDFDEPGNRKKRRFHVINMHRMMMYEPLNHYINMDLGKDGYTFLQYRMCKLFPCEPLKKPENVLGLAATLDTSVIRSEQMLWHMMLPRLLVFAEKAWRVGEHENILKAEDPSTLVVEENLAHRAGAITMEIENLMNNIAFKEGGRLDEAGYSYRVPTLGASIQLGLAFMRLPPYPLMVKSDIPRVEVEYRELTGSDQQWRPLFNVDRNTGRISGGYMFEFPLSNQKIEVRAKSAGGRNGVKRPGRSTIVEGKTEFYLPKEIPVEIREGTCLPIEDAWTTDIDNVTTLQWRRVLQNSERVLNDRSNFMVERQRVLEQTVADYNQRNRARGNRGRGTVANVALPMVFEEIQQAMDRGQNLSALPASNILRDVYQKDQAIYEQRRRLMENRYRNWQQDYLKCKEGRSRVTLLPETPSLDIAFPGTDGRGDRGQTDGRGRGQGRQTGGQGRQFGGQGRQAAGRGSAAGVPGGLMAAGGARDIQSGMAGQSQIQPGRGQMVGQGRGMRGGASIASQRRGQSQGRGAGIRGGVAGR
ncbi:beta-hexosaminidase-like [Mercenaria mercenaria]|uniref:beta-hexosaminidase-like n=1 Tax=Mercenaria mercenaria TaxID=6596 RepID=UPI00234ECC69|nr:beta-hexosaminidase-like [Mercenaria mercenaria]